MKYYKIYHYSKFDKLQSISPGFYGTGVTRGSECKHGKTGLNKTYFYVKDEPETCVSTNSYRYEIYLPYEWKNQIYDIGEDVMDLRTYTVMDFCLRFNRNPYNYEIAIHQEECIKEMGFKGWRNSASQLSHAIVLFFELPTSKPANAVIYDWNGKIIEQPSVPYFPGLLSRSGIFKNVSLFYHYADKLRDDDCDYSNQLWLSLTC